jgi:hypothetical protein
MFAGLQVALTKASALPTGLSGGTDYFVIKTSANVFKLAANLVDALAGTAIDISDTGNGTFTFTPTSLAGGNIKIQAALEDVDAKYIDLTDTNIGDASIAISGTSKQFFTKFKPEFPWYRLVLDLTAGALDYTAKITLKSEAGSK